MRLAAAALLMLLFTYMGYAKTQAIRMRERLLRAFMADLAALMAEMEYRPREIAALAQRLSKGELEAFWSDFSRMLTIAETAEEAWAEAVWGCERLSVLDRAERALICEAGEGIGARGACMQAKNTSAVSAALARRTDELHAQITQKGEMYKRLGMLMGMAAALMLI